MSQPTPYVRQANFTDHTQSYPDIPQDGTEMDAEFNAVKTTLDQTLTNLSLLQRDDGGLRPGIVDRASLADTLVLGVETPAIGWFTATSYAVGQEVWVSSKLYVCNVAHTSGVFATDLAALKWTQVLDASPAMIGIITADAQAAQAGAEAAEANAVAAAAGISSLVASVANYWATVSGTANALVLDTAPDMSAYVVGHKIRFLVGASSNTAAVSMNTSNGLGSRTIRKTTGAASPLVDLAPGDLPANTIAEIEYISDAAGYQLINVRPYSQGTDVASTGALNLNTTTGDYVGITGTTAITSMVLSQGLERTCKALGAFTLTHSANLVLPTAANIVAAVGDVFTVRGEAGGVVRVTGYMRASGGALVVDPLIAAQADRRLRGLVMSNNTTDATNDIDIAAGAAVSDDGTMILTYAGGTIQSDVVFDDTGNKGLDTGAVGNNWYHVWLVGNPTTGVTKAICSLSATAPTLFTGYTKKKCIGSFKRVAGAILPFTQRGNKFKLNTPILDVSVAGTGAGRTTALLASVPSGVVVEALFNAFTSANTIIYFTELTSAAVAPSTSAAPLATFGSGAANHAACVEIFTDASQQISFQAFANTNLYIATLGWSDPRIA